MNIRVRSCLGSGHTGVVDGVGQRLWDVHTGVGVGMGMSLGDIWIVTGDSVGTGMGGQSYTFSLKLRYGGRITLCNPPKYLGGKVTTFSDMDSDEWGIMTLREKVVELGFNKDDNLRYFSLGEKGLFEFMTDLETWNLVNNVVRPKVVEIWAILGGTGDDADVAEDANIDSDEEGEGVGGSSDGSDWEEGESANELEEFEGSEYENDKGDDQEFAKHVDPQVEYGGVQVPTNVEAEMHVEGEMQVDPQAADALNLSDDGAEFQTTARPIPQMVKKYPHDAWGMQLVSKYFVSENVYDDSSSDMPKQRWRLRNFFSANLDSFQRTVEDSYENATHLEGNNMKKSTAGEDSFVSRRKTNQKSDLEQKKVGMTADDDATSDPFDCIFGPADNMDEIHHQSPDASHTLPRKHGRSHRRSRRRHQTHHQETSDPHNRT
nr:Mitochondrial intermediate peptidase [Ipomoea batatas]